MPADMKAAREKALGQKEIARQKIEAAKRDAENQKILRKKPIPKLVDMPEPTGDGEVDSEADLTELQAGFRARAGAEADRFALATDSEYWTCFCFQTREQKEHFLAALDLLKLGDRYLDGQEVAKVLGVTLPTANVPYKTSAKVDPTWASFVRK